MSKPLKCGSTLQFFYSPRNVNDQWQGRAVLVVLAASLSWMTLIRWNTRSLALQVSTEQQPQTLHSCIVRNQPLSCVCVIAMALQRLQEENELEQPLLCWARQPLCRQEQSGGERQATQVDLAHRHFDISCLARARTGCLPLSHQSSLNQVPYLQLILSTAEVCCMHISPSHSAGLLFPPWLVEKNTPRNLCGLACKRGFSTQCAVDCLLECSSSLCYMACSNPCWAVLGRERNAWAFLFRSMRQGA